MLETALAKLLAVVALVLTEELQCSQASLLQRRCRVLLQPSVNKFSLRIFLSQKALRASERANRQQAGR